MPQYDEEVKMVLTTFENYAVIYYNCEVIMWRVI